MLYRYEFAMSIRTYESECIAQMQLETAIEVYTQGEDYFSVITLSAASEEILGKLAKTRGKTNSLDSLKKAGIDIYKHLFDEIITEKHIADRANNAKNKLKHVNPGIEPHVTLDVKEEARDMLNRAIDNYWVVNEFLTPAMESFERSQRDI